jgi:hypothetical protein
MEVIYMDPPPEWIKYYMIGGAVFVAVVVVFIYLLTFVW